MAKSNIEKEAAKIEKTFDEVSISEPKKYPEELQLALVRSNPRNIYWIADPCVGAQVEAATADHSTLQPYIQDVFIYDSPITDVGALKQILEADARAVGYMEQQIEMYKENEDFDRAVQDAYDNVWQDIAGQKGFLMETDNKLFVMTEGGQIPKYSDGITAADIADMQDFRGDEYEEVVSVFPSDEKGKFDMNVYYVSSDDDLEVKQTDSHAGYTMNEVLDYMRDDIEEFTIEDAAALENIRAVLGQGPEKGLEKEVQDRT